MPRKPAVPTIPAKPADRSKPERSRLELKHRPDPGPEQFDMWGAFAPPFEHEQAVETPAPPRAKVRKRRGSRT